MWHGSAPRAPLFWGTASTLRGEKKDCFAIPLAFFCIAYWHVHPVRSVCSPVLCTTLVFVRKYGKEPMGTVEFDVGAKFGLE